MKFSYLKFNNKAMILLEALMSLLIISLMMHGIYQIIFQYQRVRLAQTEDLTADWHQFLALLEAELSLYEVRDVEEEVIYLANDRGQYQIVLENQKIYKKPGHHPYAYQVESWTLIQRDNVIEIEMIYLNQQRFWGIVPYEK